MSLDFFFAVKPHHAGVNGWKRCQCIGSKPRVRPGDKYRSAKAEIQEQANLQLESSHRRFDDEPCYADGAVHIEVTTRGPRTHRQGPANGLAQIDVDATTKCVLDALIGTAYTDDSQVERVIATKTTDGPVGIRVRVYRPEEMESEK